jgi:vesicle coat complex subunit
MSAYEYQMQADAGSAAASMRSLESDPNGRYAGYRNAGFGVSDGPLDSSSMLPYSPFTKQEDLKTMLESNKDVSKLEAMKRLITMVAKGKHSTGT